MIYLAILVFIVIFTALVIAVAHDPAPVTKQASAATSAITPSSTAEATEPPVSFAPPILDLRATQELPNFFEQIDPNMASPTIYSPYLIDLSNEDARSR